MQKKGIVTLQIKKENWNKKWACEFKEKSPPQNSYRMPTAINFFCLEGSFIAKNVWVCYQRTSRRQKKLFDRSHATENCLQKHSQKLKDPKSESSWNQNLHHNNSCLHKRHNTKPSEQNFRFLKQKMHHAAESLKTQKYEDIYYHTKTIKDVQWNQTQATIPTQRKHYR